MSGAPRETFAPLEAIAGVRHAFLQRVPGIDVRADRATALSRLETIHAETIDELGLGEHHLITAEQVHGCEVRRVDRDSTAPVAATDGLITDDPGVVLAIYTADCGAMYFVDPVRRAIGLSHSGRKGTELNIAGHTIEAMRLAFGTEPGDLTVALGPCIRPPHYETDFAATIGAQCRAAGVGQYFDCGHCTDADADRYYSYRRELGKTGRLLALLALTP